ncbi:MAG: hypothetical protein PUP92_17220 [Rhizonema sp. PD38]|nr:hypothetical protein [Rhizonema sp. PD38]
MNLTQHCRSFLGRAIALTPLGSSREIRPPQVALQPTIILN